MAKQLFENEQYPEASAKFRKAYELKPSWKILVSIGQCEATAKNRGGMNVVGDVAPPLPDIGAYEFQTMF
ncbi:MAG: hypothetical protein JXR76_30580 [Deltaproteobacteria bacterium]|nr:hypothetical protein [Deltaproteobacteria bacterium]